MTSVITCRFVSSLPAAAGCQKTEMTTSELSSSPINRLNLAEVARSYFPRKNERETVDLASLTPSY